MKFEVDVFAWIPGAEVPNPIGSLPGGVDRWGRGACGKFFGGDNFEAPPSTPKIWAGVAGKTFRARQNVTFQAIPWGKVSDSSTTGVIPGVTTVLTDTRSQNGKVCYSKEATVLHSSSAVIYDEDSKWYEVTMRGKVQDPIPAGVGKHIAGPVAGGTASFLTPALEWNLILRLSAGSELGFWTTQRYKADAPSGLDESSKLSPSSKTLGGGTDRLLHGIITTRRFPSYAVFASLTTKKGIHSTERIFFANASSRNLVEIAVPWDSQLRSITF